MAGENWTFWLNMTNFALGIVTLLAVLVVAEAVSWDLFFMWLRRKCAPGMLSTSTQSPRK